MFVADSEELQKLYNASVDLTELASFWSPQLRAFLRRVYDFGADLDRQATITRSYHPLHACTRPAYVGLARSYSRHLHFIELKTHRYVDQRVLLMHEICHVLGGTEFDSRIVEGCLMHIIGRRPFLDNKMAMVMIPMTRGNLFSVVHRSGGVYLDQLLVWQA